jgi:ABC-type oligopeptide transport system substrate-binding subunit
MRISRRPWAAFLSADQGLMHMRKIILAAAVAGAALSLAACSESTENAAGEAVDNAMADTEANLEAVGEEVDETATEAGAAVDEAGDDIGAATDEAGAEAEQAGNEIEADAQDETTQEAAVD